jgi:hypothetical protein
MLVVDAKENFGERHFQAAELGDKRRTARLVAVANTMRRQPGGTLPDKLHEPAELKALYRLCNSDDVTHEAVLAPHRDKTLESLKGQQRHLLILHDTTTLDYSTLESLEGLGTIGNGNGRGYLCHNSLVVEPTGRTVLGLANQILHRRARVSKKEGKGAHRERVSRESRLWLQGTEPLPASKWLVDVCDRGADTFEFLEHECNSGRRFVIRSAYSRRAILGHGEKTTPQGLHEIARNAKVLGSRKINVSGAPGRKGRTVKVYLSATAVQVVAPRQKMGHHGNAPLPMWIVRVWEPHPRKGKKRLEWFLLTNYPAKDFSAAKRVCIWYECRWIVEEYHKAMKTGCGVETLQFQSEEAQKPAIALLSVLALTLLNLRDAARQPDAKTKKAIDIVDRTYVRVLSAKRYKKDRDDLTIHEFFYALARLGGHQNRRGDHRPGWLILWRGWEKLQHMVEGAVLMQGKKCGYT